MPVDSNAVSAATVSLGQTVVAYSFFLPPLRDVRRADKEDSITRGDVRMGQVAAGALSLGIGAMFANLTGSPVPVYVSLLTAAIIAVLYEIALQGNQLFEGQKS